MSKLGDLCAELVLRPMETTGSLSEVPLIFVSIGNTEVTYMEETPKRVKKGHLARLWLEEDKGCRGGDRKAAASNVHRTIHKTRPQVAPVPTERVSHTVR